jgi:8-oxo-dGTP pyrophosphatase MutT (NUDIX family)
MSRKENNFQNVRTRTSAGIIVCRINQKTNRPEALLAHKRYTYAFAEFIHGKYASGDITSRNQLNARSQHVNALLSKMTREELLDIMSLNFQQMWFRVWLISGDKDIYNLKHAKFCAAFMKDGGKQLRTYVLRARAAGRTLWEFPKGHHNFAESDMDCAARELQEETGMMKKDYKFIPGVTRSVSYISAGTQYNVHYVVAVANKRVSTRLKFNDGTKPTIRNLTDMNEIGDIEWMDITQIRLVDDDKQHIETLVKPIFNIVKKYVKGTFTFPANTQLT